MEDKKIAVDGIELIPTSRSERLMSGWRWRND